MASIDESSLATPKSTNEKPVIVRVKRKASVSPIDAFWLEINERPIKRPLLDFGKLSISESSEELKSKKVLVKHVETVTSPATIADIVQSFVPNSVATNEAKIRIEERRHTFKRGNRPDQVSKSREKQEKLAKHARFELIWRRRKGGNKEVDEMCQFYDVVRVDNEEGSSNVREQEDMSLEDQKMLSSFLPLLREYIPSAAEDIESDIQACKSKKDEYVYDYYTVKDDMDVSEEDDSYPFPLVQVDDDDDDFYCGPDESEYSDDSNAEDNPRNDYPDEESEEEESEAYDESDEDNEKASEKSSSSEDRSDASSEKGDLLYDDEISEDYDDDADRLDYGSSDDNGSDKGEDWRWSYR